MADTVFQAGSTSKIVTVEAITISTGLPYTAGAYNTSGLSITYTRDGSTPTTITPVTATAGTYTSSGFVHRGKGVYEIGAPTAALASGSTGVEFAVDGITNVLFRGCRVELMADDPRGAAATTTEIRNAILNWEPYTGYSLARLLRVMGITLRGTASGLAGTSVTYTAPAGGATVTATVDANGNRSAVSDDAAGTP